MPALVWGVAAIEDVVGPIVARGHDVQLHCHSEWLELAPGNGLTRRTGRNIKDLPFDDQARVLEWARDTLVAAGAPQPVAFRAGNYGANDDTLRALAAIGIEFDSSHCPALVGSGHCDISLDAADRRPLWHRGLVEVPVGCIEDFGGGLRHAQVTALSLAELTGALAHARRAGIESFTVVSHSFELTSRDRIRRNRVVARRFEQFCAALAAMPGCRAATYAETPPRPEAERGAPVLAFNPIRGGARVVEQAVSNVLYATQVSARTKQTVSMGMMMLC
ncbi:hypothetical protein J4558_03655 [Leptolyngbya sp. 15MV]|nr:hypothetical protein J4558_03655 [Leptolyngbya sp. 15MV]